MHLKMERYKEYVEETPREIYSCSSSKMKSGTEPEKDIRKMEKQGMGENDIAINAN